MLSLESSYDNLVSLLSHFKDKSPNTSYYDKNDQDTPRRFLAQSFK
ncbi:hypothetical protein L291_3855 [Acinetobacter guillouiae MSP4-18]|nr:hypothetical protein L291_3855 [Acinetobacter guillouiae MSP4-18]